MAVHGKGLICMPMSAELCQKLAFPQMVTENTDNHETAFTAVSYTHLDVYKRQEPMMVESTLRTRSGGMVSISSLAPTGA